MKKNKKTKQRKVKRGHVFPHFFFRIILGIVVLLYLTLGIAALIGGETAINLGKGVYGLNINLDAQALYIIKIVGVLFITIGILGIFAWDNPIKNSAISNGIALLLLLRGIQRIIYLKDIQNIFGLSSGRIISGSLILFLGAILLFILNPRRSIDR